MEERPLRRVGREWSCRIGGVLFERAVGELSSNSGVRSAKDRSEAIEGE